MIDSASYSVTAQIKVIVERADPSVPMPSYAKEGDSGVDLSAFITQPIVLEPGQQALIDTGLKLALPMNIPPCEIQIRPRSGLALKHGLSVTNSPGTLDQSYRGPVKVIAINLGQEPFTITPLMRIAQAVVVPVLRVQYEEGMVTDDTARGSGGFGSTGFHHTTG